MMQSLNIDDAGILVILIRDRARRVCVWLFRSLFYHTEHYFWEKFEIPRDYDVSMQLHYDFCYDYFVGAL